MTNFSIAGSVLKLLFQWTSHLLIFYKSPLRLLVLVSDFLTVEKGDVSLENNVRLH